MKALSEGFIFLHPGVLLRSEPRLLESRGGRGWGRAYPAVVFCLLPSVIGELGKDAPGRCQEQPGSEWAFQASWQGFQIELIWVVTQLAVVQCQFPEGFSSFQGLEFKRTFLREDRGSCDAECPPPLPLWGPQRRLVVDAHTDLEPGNLCPNQPTFPPWNCSLVGVFLYLESL